MKSAFSKTLGLVSQNITTKTVPVDLPVDHIVAIDVSGSMSSALVELRRHLKNKLSTLVGEKDTISLIWFSGKNEFGILQEAVPVRSLADLSSLHNAIDKWLQPVGLTGFKQPIDETVSLVSRLKASRDSLINFIFMTDGYDNQWTSKDILKSVETLSAKVDATTIVEYGWNCNRDLLAQMAETAGGVCVFAENFNSYQNTFESQMGRKIGGGKKYLLKLADRATLGCVFTYEADGQATTYSVNDNNEILIPESVSQVHYFSNGENVDAPAINQEATLIGLGTLAQRMKANEIFTILSCIGDVALINRFVNAFSKQDYTDFQNVCAAAAVNPALRCVEGVDFNLVPKEDAFTVLDLLNEFTSNDENLIFPLDESFGYKKIGDDTKQKDESTKFSIANPSEGVSMRNIVFNATRPNASLNVRFNGEVILSPESKHHGLPPSLKSFIYRSYTIIRDGIVHTRNLPVALCQETLSKLNGLGVALGQKAGQKFVLDISKLPVINRNMVKTVTAKETFKSVVDLEILKASQKVFKYYRDQSITKTSEGFTKLYGDEATAWLKEQGVTDYNGFNPSVEKVASNDVYMAKELDISVAKLSSLPKVEDVLTKLDSGKSLTLREEIMKPAIMEVKAFFASDLYKNAGDKVKESLNLWLDAKATEAISMVRNLNMEISKTKFAIVVGHSWFSDLPAGEGSLVINVGGTDFTVTAKLEEKEV